MGAVKRNTLSVLFIIKKAKLLKNGEAPICMRITVNKRVAEVMIKRSIPVDLWNQKKECSKGKDRVATELNYYINTVRAKVLQIHRELEIDNKPITADTIKDCFYGRDKVSVYSLEKNDVSNGSPDWLGYNTIKLLLEKYLLSCLGSFSKELS